ncbi:MAG: hypothetical protein K0Q76_3662 [Panacagrimonas sp.]|jgi:hypothetical protein|nr:hypothetical protein [Panacagrimonas sp.]MCC2658554.1 hypothetical protein [Panacagrimonas sp.]
MSRLARKAEILKLARVLGVGESDLAYLSNSDPASIREFREQASARLFDADEARLRRVAAASKLLPVPLIALIAEHVFGALLCARVAGLIAPDRAAELAQRLRVGFLADVTLEIDPRHVREVIKRIPTARIVEVALELAKRGEFVTLARFVDYVSTDAIKAVMEKLTDNAALLHVAFFVEDKSRLNDLVGLLPEARIKDIIFLAADESQDLWSEALALMNDVSPALRKRLGELAATLDESILMSMARSAQAKGLWSAVLPIVGVMATPHQRRLLQLPVLNDEGVLDSIVKAVDVDHLWEALIPLVPMMQGDQQSRLANLPMLRESRVLDAVLKATDVHGLWSQLLPLVPLMNDDGQQRLVLAAEKLSDATFGRIFDAVQASRTWSPLLVLLLRTREDVRARIAPLVARLSPDSARLIAQEAERIGALDRLEKFWVSLANAK